MQFLTSLVAAGLLAGVTALPAVADDVTFVGPAGWSANPTNASPPDPAHAALQWHLSGDESTSVTYLRTTTSYDDALAAIHANFTTNKIKASLDQDLTCRGKTSHVIEFATGPAGHQVVIHRMLVPMMDGVAAITYAREGDVAFDPAVKAAETAFCAATS
jgi:hypothetical protein